MTAQLSRYDKTQGQILRDMGLESVELHNEDFVRSARNIARKLAEMNGQVTMDDVREVFDKLAIAPRHCNPYEINPAYFEAACERIEQSQRQMKLAL